MTGTYRTYPDVLCRPPKSPRIENKINTPDLFYVEPVLGLILPTKSLQNSDPIFDFLENSRQVHETDGSEFRKYFVGGIKPMSSFSVCCYLKKVLIKNVKNIKAF